MLDRLVVQVQEHITTLEKGNRNLTEDAKTDLFNATRLVKDASATKQVQSDTPTYNNYTLGSSELVVCYNFSVAGLT